jgi:rod shape-determining protein MreC
MAMMTPPLLANRSRILLGVLLLAHLVVISGQVESGNGKSLLFNVAFGVLSPIRRIVSGTYAGLRDALGSYVDLRNLKKENRRLSERLRLVETELNTRRHYLAETDRLRSLLELRERLPFQSIAAELVSAEGLPWASVITVNRGTLHGVRLNTPAICRTGVVGRVIAVGPHAAKIQLIIDRDSGIGVMVERSRTTGVLEGVAASRGELPMRYVAAAADVRVGDTIVTSGLDEIYPKGLLVGYVSRIEEQSGLLKEVYVAPSAQFDRLEEMLLLRVPQTSIETPEAVH